MLPSDSASLLGLTATLSGAYLKQQVTGSVFGFLSRYSEIQALRRWKIKISFTASVALADPSVNIKESKRSTTYPELSACFRRPKDQTTCSLPAFTTTLRRSRRGCARAGRACHRRGQLRRASGDVPHAAFGKWSSTLTSVVPP